MKTITQERFEEQRDKFRDAFLAALDEAAAVAYCELRVPLNPRGGVGATDDDLPELFRSVDAQLLRILARAGVTVAA